MAAAAASDVNVGTGTEVPRFVIIGAAGDGKSSIIKKLLFPAVEQPVPEDGMDGEGTTKEIKEYAIAGPNGELWGLIDTMGVGDWQKGVGTLIAGLKHVLQCGRQVDGIIVTQLIVGSRVGMAVRIVRQIITHGMVRNDSGVSPWERIIVCGTQRDRCRVAEIARFPVNARLFFQDCSVPHKEHQIATCSAEEPDGMADLLANMSVLGRNAMVWDPNFEVNDGSRRMAAGVCDVTGGDETLTRLELEMQLAWTEVRRQETIGHFISKSGAAVNQAGVVGAADEVTSWVAASVGEKVVRQYTANQAATGVGSGMIKGGVQIAKGSEVQVGEAMIKAMNQGGTATLKSRSGNVVVNVAVESAVSTGIRAGSSLSAGVCGIGAELVAAQFDCTKEYKRTIGLGAQVGAGACLGAAAGPLGATLGAGVGAISWGAGQVLGNAAETAILNAKGEDSPTVLAYKKAKGRYEAALKSAKEKSEAAEESA